MMIMIKVGDNDDFEMTLIQRYKDEGVIYQNKKYETTRATKKRVDYG